MNAQRLLSKLDMLGIKVRVDGNRLRYAGPEELITPDLLHRLKANKAELLGLLAWDEERRMSSCETR